MPFNIFGDDMNVPPTPLATPFNYPSSSGTYPPPSAIFPPASTNARGAPPAPSPYASVTAPRPLPVPLPFPRPPFAPPNPASMASAPAPAPSPGTPFGSLGGLANDIASPMANAMSAHPLTLMALGAGIAQGGVGRGLELAQAAAQAERNLMAQQVNYRQTYNALTGAGVPPDEALAAVMNPSLMHALAVRYLGPRAAAGGPAPRNASAAANPTATAVNSSAASNAPSTPGTGVALPGPGAAATPTGSQAMDLRAASSTPALGRAPARPPNVPNDALYSPTRKVWRDSIGNRFDATGRALQ